MGQATLRGRPTPYLANLLEAAGTPRTRRRLYRGHGAQDVGDLYEAHEVAAFLAEDAARLNKHIGSYGQSHRMGKKKTKAPRRKS